MEYVLVNVPDRYLLKEAFGGEFELMVLKDQGSGAEDFPADTDALIP